MLASVLAALLAASLGPPPHALRPEDTCLMRTRCDRGAVYCLVEQGRCKAARERAACLVAGCGELPLLEP